jgi:acetolactate synthase-1/3 small subunit
MHEPEPIVARYAIRVHNRPGALAKIAAVFHRRHVNIETLAVAPSAGDRELSDMTIGVRGARAEQDRIAAALRNLVDVLDVEVR